MQKLASINDLPGEVVFAFFESYSGVTSLQAETRVLCTSLELCYKMHSDSVVVEVDSKVLIDSVCGKSSIPAKLRPNYLMDFTICLQP
ncbi:unnamed protein product [Coffea canephora]|uniref:DH200=94 genomic scaffold, scaffold_88 n=1 Tax=Coffea canephora TaxID=49390 RepID=A0A068V1S0_COFCA|nr:unnamed protein product [Coffea canephora]